MDRAPDVAGLLLAAGAGRRYGMPKALVRHGDALLVERALSTLRDGGCDPVVVVLGAAADEVRTRAALPGAIVVENPDWATGMGSSLRVGLETLATTAESSAHEPESSAHEAARSTPAPQAVVVLLVDTPGITSAAVERLAALAAPDALAVATYQGERGHPVLLGRSHWAGAAELAVGDVGARAYLRRYDVREVPCDDIADGTDLDHPPT